MAANILRPPYAPGLGEIAIAKSIPGGLTAELIPLIRESTEQFSSLESILARNPTIIHEQVTIPSVHGEIIMSIFRPVKREEQGQPLPGIYWIHGGGFFTGNRFTGFEGVGDWITTFSMIAITVEYRRTPEHPYPVPLDDCYNGLLWVGSNLAPLGIDPSKLLISGGSAGGCLAAGTTLMARDLGGPEILAQLLLCPMLDHRGETTSVKQYQEQGVWSGKSNSAAWRFYLRESAENPTIYASPGTAQDLERLPQTYLDVGSADSLRDEGVSYATRLWASGVQVELHVWPGGFHGFEGMAPEHTISKTAEKTRRNWISRILGGSVEV